MDWLIVRRAGAAYSLPLHDLDRVVPWSAAMTWIGRGSPAGLVLGDAPPMVVHEPGAAAGAPGAEPRFVVLRGRANGGCAVALLADRVDLAPRPEGAVLDATAFGAPAGGSVDQPAALSTSSEPAQAGDPMAPR